MSKFVQRNINELKRLKQSNTKNSNRATVKRVDEIIKLYTERNISNVATAENLIKGLTSDDKRTYDKAFQKYKDNIKKVQRSQTNKRKNSRDKGKEYSQNIFYKFSNLHLEKPKE